MEKTKICKTCGKEIAKSAKVCPNCGAKKKSPIKYVILAVIALVIIGAFAGGGDKEEPKDIEYTSYSIASLNKMLEENAMQAEELEDTYIETTGIISVIDSDGEYISITDPEDEWDIVGIQCYLKDDDQKELVKSLKKGSTVTVKGKVSDVGEVMGYMMDLTELSAQ